MADELIEVEGSEIPLIGDADPKPPEPSADKTEVALDEPQGDTVTIGEDVAGEPEERGSRKQRGRIRYDEAIARAERAEAAAAEAAQNAARLQGQIEALQRMPAAPPAAPSGPDPEEARKSKVREEMEGIVGRRTSLLREMNDLQEAGKLDASEQRRLQKEDLDLQVDFARKAASLDRPPAPAQPQITPEDIRTANMQTAIEMQFPDIYHNREAQTWARGRHYQLVAAGWDPMDIRTFQQAYTDTRSEFMSRQGATPAAGNYPPAYPQAQFPPAYPQANAHAPPIPAPLPYGSQSRMMGPPRGEAASSGEGPIQVQMTPEHRARADMLYDYEPNPKVRYQRYANTVLKNHILANRKKRT